MLAASTASSDLVELLISRGANANFQKEMYTVLMATCAASRSVAEEQVLRCVELLLGKNARVNVYDKYRMSPLMYAAREGRVTVCEKLLDHGAEVNKQEMRGWTSLAFAAGRGHGRVVRTLLDRGADANICTNDGQTPSDIAYASDYPRLSDVIALAASGKPTPSTEVALDAAKPTIGPIDDSPHTYGSLEMFLMGQGLKHLLPKFQVMYHSCFLILSGAEDSDSEDDGFYMGSSYTGNSNHNKFGMRNGGDMSRSVSSSKGFTTMPAGAESDDEDSDGLKLTAHHFILFLQLHLKLMRKNRT
ncbi:PREDICTED: ankyrin repeat, SAM and basic leucine zipper domain-containing protein 1-like [Acropora digitifera]|uniref:ankyrin repeat, SAM and basic leucine zipper domain-containing protein 1-like n=1 Tax=Acropora digitifera TaxID=70779 RepID=UPI00077ADB89|nr:PREDICTED: ankyrin repeat, SAM and basic leucine zipper domain-containing protein 1-like [Acropora digitifera]